MQKEVYALTEILDDIVERGYYEIVIRPSRPIMALGPVSRFRYEALDVKMSAEEMETLLEKNRELAEKHRLSIVQIRTPKNRFRLTETIGPTSTAGKIKTFILRRIAHCPVLDDTIEGYPLADRIKRAILEESTGLNFVIGPVGSGKSGLLAAIFRTLRENGHSVYYVDPEIEFDLASVESVARASFAIVVPERPKNFIIDHEKMLADTLYRTSGIRDVFVGEVRDDDEIEVLYRIAEKGYRVWTTIHAGHPYSFLIRLNRIFKDGWMWLTRMILNVRLFVHKENPSRVVPVAGLYCIREIERELSLNDMTPDKIDEILERLVSQDEYMSFSFRYALAWAIHEGRVDPGDWPYHGSDWETVLQRVNTYDIYSAKGQVETSKLPFSRIRIKPPLPDLMDVEYFVWVSNLSGKLMITYIRSSESLERHVHESAMKVIQNEIRKLIRKYYGEKVPRVNEGVSVVFS